jgi:NAD(P)-dependent dehydrogenase (short-subunit alcohol dehydrogenase family)
MDFLKSVYNIDGKVAVITGGTGVIGGELAKGLLAAGAKVVIFGTTEKSLKSKHEQLGYDNANLLGIICNVLDEDNLNSANDKILERFGKIDILINAAGGHVPGAVIGENQSVFDLKISEFKKVTNLNLNGTVLPTLIFGKTMAKQKRGSVINISSMTSFRTISRAVGYSAAKAAVDNFTKWMAVELAQKFGNGIRVNAIAPGFLLTSQNRALLTNEDGSLTERGKMIINMTPFKRFGEPEELIGTVIWLASDASKFVTGSIIPIDGGFSIYSGV